MFKKNKNDNIYKSEPKKLDDQMNFVKYRVQSYNIKINLPNNHHSKINDDKAI